MDAPRRTIVRAQVLDAGPVSFGSGAQADLFLCWLGTPASPGIFRADASLRAACFLGSYARTECSTGIQPVPPAARRSLTSHQEPAAAAPAAAPVESSLILMHRYQPNITIHGSSGMFTAFGRISTIEDRRNTP